MKNNESLKNAEKRFNVWYATLTVPADVQHLIGKAKLFQSTKTGNIKEAALRVSLLVEGWKAQIAKARGTMPSPKATFWENLRREYISAQQRDADENTDMNAPDWGHYSEAVRDSIKAEATKIKDPNEAKMAYRVAVGLVTPLAPLVADWKLTLRMAQKTIDQQHRDVMKMAGHFVSLGALTPQKIKVWTDKLIREGVTASSFERLGNGCRSFWLYLQESNTKSMIDPDPFVGPFRLAQRTAVRNTVDREAFTPAELSKIYAAALAQGEQPLADLIALGAYTGARIEELCMLTKDTAKDGFFHMGTKTKASVRDCPIHAAIIPLVARLISASTDGFLIPSTARNQYKTRSKPLSQKFGRLKKAMGFGPTYVFHSTRHTLATLLYQAGVRPEIIADVVGHETGNFTLDKYVKNGSSMEQKLDAISRVAYPAPLDSP